MKCIFKNLKVLKNKNKLSLILWIVLNKKMSISQKTHRFLAYQSLIFAKLFRQGRQRTLVCVLSEVSLISCKKLSRRIELLMKKGYIIRLELSLSEKNISNIDSEAQKVLIRLVNLLIQQKQSRYF